MRDRIIKYFMESLEEDVLDYTKEPSVADWSAKELAISYANSKKVGDLDEELHFRKYIEDPQDNHSYVIIGVFKGQEIVAGLAYFYTKDLEKFGINRKVPLVEKMVVNKEYRGQGISKELYVFAIRTEKILYSDVTLFGPTAKMWETFIPRYIGVEMFNFNDVTGEYSEFSIEEYKASMDMRLVAVIDERLKATIKNVMRSKELV
jgi:hypothetical protein